MIGPLTINATSAVASAADYVLTATYNSPAITIPSGATAMIIVPPVTNTTALFMAGDTGAADAEAIDIDESNPTLVSLGSSPTVYLKTASSTVTVEIIFI